MVVLALSQTERIRRVLDWAGEFAIAGALPGYLAGQVFRFRDFRRVKLDVAGYVTDLIKIDPLSWAGYWSLVGGALGVIVGLTRY